MAIAANADSATARPRLVVLRALGLGDVLTAVPALRALAGAFPHHDRILAAPQTFSALLDDDDLVGRVVDTDLRAGGDTAPLRPLPAALHGAAIAVNLHGRGPQSTALLEQTCPERLLAYDRDGPVWRDDEHEVERWCRLLRHSGLPADPDALDLDVQPARHADGATVVHPGAASAARRWPASRWAAVARAEMRQGRRVLVTGSAAETDLAGAVAHQAGLGDDAVLAGRTDVVALAATIAAAGRVVCGDTGVAHLATATRTPSVVLFGPTSPARWGPPAARPWHRALWHGRTGDPHAATPDPALLAITVDDVLDALATLPERAELATCPT